MRNKLPKDEANQLHISGAIITNAYGRACVYEQSEGRPAGWSAIRNELYQDGSQPKSYKKRYLLIASIASVAGALTGLVLPAVGTEDLRQSSDTEPIAAASPTEEMIDDETQPSDEPEPTASGQDDVEAHSASEAEDISQEEQPSDDEEASMTPQQCIASWPTEKIVGQMSILNIDNTGDTQVYQRLLSEDMLGGVILMQDTPKDTVDALATAGSLNPAISTDNESVSVQRFDVEPKLPTGPEAVKMGEDAYRELVAAHYKALAERGVDWVYAPVADVATTEGDHPIDANGANRTFSNEPEKVAKYAIIQAEEAIKAGITAFIKHFPGGMSNHTDFESATTPPIDEMQRDLLPFEEFAKVLEQKQLNNFGLMMGSAAITDGADGGGTDGIPASLHPAAYELAEEKGYDDNIIITDALNGEAVKNHSANDAENVTSAFVAGADVAMVFLPQDGETETSYRNIVSYVARQISEGKLSLDEAAQSVYELLLNRGLTEQEILATCSS